jgi:hypothetical protein
VGRRRALGAVVVLRFVLLNISLIAQSNKAERAKLLFINNIVKSTKAPTDSGDALTGC